MPLLLSIWCQLSQLVAVDSNTFMDISSMDIPLIVMHTSYFYPDHANTAIVECCESFRSRGVARLYHRRPKDVPTWAVAG